MKLNLSSLLVSNVFFLALFFAIFLPGSYGVNAQTAPSISYSSPQVIERNRDITAISPTNTGGAVPAGTYSNVSVLAGSTNGFTDATTGISARFKQPTGVTIDAAGNIYVADCYNHRIRKVTPAGVVTTLAGDGYEWLGYGRLVNGNGTSASFSYPTDIAIHPDGSCLYVVDKENHVIRRISLTSPYAVTTFAGTGSAGFANHASNGLSAQFRQPEGIAFDASGATHYLYIADRANHRIRRIKLSSTSGATASAGEVTTFAGSGTATFLDGAGSSAGFNNPVQVAVSGDGTNIYVADMTNHRIRRIQNDVVTTWAGSGTAGGVNGSGGGASFNMPYGIELDGEGNLIVSESGGHRLRKVTTNGSSGEVSTLAGIGSSSQTDGIGTAAGFSTPSGMVWDADDALLYVADQLNNRIRKVEMSGYQISPALPAGLSLATATGIITGTPTTRTAATNYTITAYNYSGMHSTSLSLTVADLPTLTTTAPSSFGLTSASSGGNITSDGGIPVTARGVVWSRTGSLKISLSTKTSNGTGIGSFSSSLTGLISNTTYYVRAYATTAVGTAWGNEVIFNTLHASPSISYSQASVTLSVGNAANLNLNSTGGTPDVIHVSRLAGGNLGYLDGTGSLARFYGPIGVAIDGSGNNLYVGDRGNHRIRKIEISTGVVTTLAGDGVAGFADGNVSAARFNYPEGLTMDGNDILYVAVRSNNRIRKIVISTGQVTTIAGNGTSGLVDNAVGTSAQFSGPSGLAIDGSGNLIVVDNTNNAIRNVELSTGKVTTIAGGSRGYVDGAIAVAKFGIPSGATLDVAGNIYVSEYENHTVRKISPSGIVSTLAGSGTGGFADGLRGAAQFNQPRYITNDESGNIYVTDSYNSRIRKITSSGDVTTLAGSGVQSIADGTGTAAGFRNPHGIMIDANDNLYIVDAGNQAVRLIARYRIDPALPQGLFFDARTGTISGTPTAAMAARTYTVYAQNSMGGTTATISIAIASAPTVTTVAATNVTSTTATLNATVNANGATTTALTIKYSMVQADVDAGNGTSATVSPTSATGSTNTSISAAITGLTAGTTYYFRVSATNSAGTTNGSTLSFTTAPPAPNISYAGASSPVTLSVGTAMTPLIITNSGGAVEPMQVVSVAGSAVRAYLDATGFSASFNYPHGVAVDGSGNLYIADRDNHRIRKMVISTGVVTTLAGSGTASWSDGTGTGAGFNSPTGIAVDATGTNLYVADNMNHRIRKIVISTGVVSTLAGSGATALINATGAAASFRNPTDIALDGSGNLYVVDQNNNAIRKVVISTGAVTTLAGSVASGSTDGTGTSARLNSPFGIAIDATGTNLYVTEINNSCIRKIDISTGMVSTLAGSTAFGHADGTGTAAKFWAPRFIDFYRGNLYVSDQFNHRIRKVDIFTGQVSTLAGSSSSGFMDGSGGAARFSILVGMAVDGNGNFFVTDNGRIRTISVYAITPALPAGLNFDPADGTISGTPTEINSAKTYTVSSSNLGGPSTTTFTLSVGASMMTTAASAITETTATSGGTVDATQFAGATQKGVCWNTTGNPEITDYKTTEGSGTGVFTSNLTGLAPNTTYYVRSYVTVGSTTTYGNAVNFKTNSLGTFSDITKTFGDAKFSLTAPTAVSTGAFTYASSDAGVATVSGSEVTIVGAGTTTITATQASAGAYASATKTLTLTVNKATPSITLNIPTSTTLAAASNMSIAGTASNGEPVTIALGSGTATGSLSGSPGSYLLNSVSATGNLVFNASTPATANFDAGSKSVTMDVTKNNQTITFGSLTPVTYSSGLTQTLTATTSATGLTVTYTLVSGLGSITGNTLTITGPGLIKIRASQAGDGSYNPAPDVEQTLTVNPGAPTITGFTPTSATQGDVVTITGTNFQNVTSVKFNTTAATSFTVVNATTITAVVGSGHTGAVSVTTTGGTDTEPGFRYKVTWTGATNAFNQNANWTGNRPPQTDDDIIFSPTAASDLELDGSKTVGNVDFNGSGRSLRLGGHNLTVKGNLSMPGNFSGSGKVIMQGTSAQTIRGGGDIPDLEINNSSGVTIDASGDELTVSGTLRATSGTLRTNGKLRLISNSSGTARVGVVTGTITGNIIAERFFQRSTINTGNGRAWRLVSVPVTGSGNLRDFFMNGRSGQDLTLQTSRDAETENSGTPIVGHNYATASEATTAGFDWIGVPNQMSSLRYYSAGPGGGNFASENVPSMTTNYTNADQGYMIFTRGDRKLDFPSTTSAGYTTFRSTGSLKTGTRTVSVAPPSTSKYTLVGNPYMSVLDLDAFYTTNSLVINPSFWIWDGDYLAGSLNQGGYVNVYKSGSEWVTNTGRYFNPQLLESGMAFFVEPLATLATATNISILESHKAASSVASTWTGTDAKDVSDDHARLYVGLERADSRGQRHIIDGVMADFHSSFKETLTDMSDREKLRNGISRGALWIPREGKSLSGEGLPWPKDVKRSIPLSMSGVGDQTLLVHINPTGMRDRYVKAWLKDNVLKREVEINMSQPTDYDFIGTGRADWDSTRFEIVYVEAGRPGTGVTLEPDEVAETPSVKLYPNPSKTAEVKLSLRAMTPGAYTVQVLDMTGRLVATSMLEHRSVNGEYRVLQGRLLSPGQYLVRLIDADKQLKETLRMMVE